jgi:hypothetical protein
MRGVWVLVVGLGVDLGGLGISGAPEFLHLAIGLGLGVGMAAPASGAGQSRTTLRSWVVSTALINSWRAMTMRVSLPMMPLTRENGAVFVGELVFVNGGTLFLQYRGKTLNAADNIPGNENRLTTSISTGMISGWEGTKTGSS